MESPMGTTKADHVKDNSNNRIKHHRATRRQQNFLRLDVWISQPTITEICSIAGAQGIFGGVSGGDCAEDLYGRIPINRRRRKEVARATRSPSPVRECAWVPRLDPGPSTPGGGLQAASGPVPHFLGSSGITAVTGNGADHPVRREELYNVC